LLQQEQVLALLLSGHRNGHILAGKLKKVSKVWEWNEQTISSHFEALNYPPFF
jgi:hypothetical protein